MVLGELVPMLLTNPYFSAGAGLLGVGTGMAVLRQGYKYSNSFVRVILIIIIIIIRSIIIDRRIST